MAHQLFADERKWRALGVWAGSGGRSRGRRGRGHGETKIQLPPAMDVICQPGMKQNSSVLVDDSFSCFCPEKHCFVPGSDGRPLCLHPQLVSGKYGNVPRLQLQLFRRLGCLNDGLVWVELHDLQGTTACEALLTSLGYLDATLQEM